MKKLMGAAVLAVALLGAVESKAVEQVPRTVQQLLAACQPDNPWILYCYGFVDAVTKTMSIIGGVKGGLREKLGNCGPDSTTTGQDVQIFINWAKANPTKWQSPGLSGVILALREAWPC